MAYKPNPTLIAFLFIIAGIAFSASGARDMKKPEWLIDPNDGSMLIPGIGRVMLPGHNLGHKPYTGPTSFVPDNNLGHKPYLGPTSSVPGIDDTFVPNPGVEVPNPVPAPVTDP